MMEKEDKLKSYFDESLFLDGIYFPKNQNIAPKTDTKLDMSTGYKYHQSKYSVDSFEISKLSVGDTSLELQGTFLISEIKDYDYFWNNVTKQQTDCNVMPFMMLDHGKFESKIKICDMNTIIMKTHIDIIRYVDGCNFDGKSVRAGMFKKFLYEDCKDSLEIVEYYKTIANQMRLLHYSSYSDYFEVYNLPPNWNLSIGLSKLNSPKVFDDKIFDSNDKDLEEINTILNSLKIDKNPILIRNIS